MARARAAAIINPFQTRCAAELATDQAEGLRLTLPAPSEDFLRQKSTYAIKIEAKELPGHDTQIPRDHYQFCRIAGSGVRLSHFVVDAQSW